MSVAPLVLAYHALGVYSRRQDPHHLTIDPERFYAQALRLRARGLEFVSMSELGRRIHDGRPLENVAALTFDDGSLDNLTILPAILDDLGVPATVFACPGLLGDPHPFLNPESGLRLMNAGELRELAANPRVEIGSHTSGHEDLSAAGAEEAYRELVRSREELEELLQSPVLSFAYPKGSYSPACPAAAERAGYLTAVTTGLGAPWLPYELPRACISTLDGRVTFELKTRGLYDGLWASPAGRVARHVVRPFRHGRFARSAS